MNILKVFLLIIILNINYACKKENNFDPDGYYGEGTALLNGKPYKGKVGIFNSNNLCKPDTCIGINIDYFNEYGEKRGDITIDIVFLKTGKFQLGYVYPFWTPYGPYSLTYGELAGDGDVVTGVYFTFQKDSANWLNIKKLDLKSGEISGDFQATVVRAVSFTPKGQIPDTIKITNGSFLGKINWSK